MCWLFLRRSCMRCFLSATWRRGLWVKISYRSILMSSSHSEQRNSGQYEHTPHHSQMLFRDWERLQYLSWQRILNWFFFLQILCNSMSKMFCKVDEGAALDKWCFISTCHHAEPRESQRTWQFGEALGGSWIPSSRIKWMENYVFFCPHVMEVSFLMYISHVFWIRRLVRP